MFPLVKSRAFKGELRLVATERLFDLPAAGVTSDNAPGLFEILGRFIGQEVPGFFTCAAAGDDQPKRMLIQENGNCNYPDFEHATSVEIGQLSMAPRTNAPSKVRRLLGDALCVTQQVTSWPAHHEAHPLLNSLTQPEVAGKAPIPGMYNPFSPTLVRLGQQLSFYSTLIAGLGPPLTPPTHLRQ